MPRGPRPLRVPLALALLGATLVGGVASGGDGAPAPAPAPPTARVTRHRIEARFEPRTRRVVAIDVLDLEGGASAVEFSLPEAVRVLSVRAEGGIDLPFAKRGAGPTSAEGPTYAVELPPGLRAMEVRYAGKISPEGRSPRGPADLGGASAWWIVSEQGIDLPRDSGWYPRPVGDGLARFDITTYVPAPFLVVTQGAVPERSEVAFPTGWASEDAVTPPGNLRPKLPGAVGGSAGATYRKSVARSALPTDGCALSAGPYLATTREIEGIPVTTYFLPTESAEADRWLDATEMVMARYERTLGTYPHPKLDLVQNLLFPASAARPSYVLLGSSVVDAARAAVASLPTQDLESAYLRGWYGNGLLADPRGGDWIEALTFYLSRMWAKEHASPPTDTAARRAALELCALRLWDGTASPVPSLRDPSRDPGDVVSAGQGALVFHMLRRKLGDAEFFARVKRFSTDRIGTRVTWDDWLKLLDGAWVGPWLERSELPAIRLVTASTWPARKERAPGDADATRWVVQVQAVLDGAVPGAPWPALDLDVDVDGKKAGTLRLEGPGGRWRGFVEGAAPTSVALDARCEVLRRLRGPADLPAHMPPRTLTIGLVSFGDERAALADAVMEGLTSDRLEGRRPGTKGHDEAMQRLRLGLRADGYAPVEGLGQDGLFEFALGVADRLSSGDLLLTTDAGPETIRDAFVPLSASPERAKGAPLPYAEGAGAVPAPGRLADPSPEGLARFWAQVESGTAPALLLAPSKEARTALASFLDAPNALTPESGEQFSWNLDPASWTAHPRWIAAWIAARRAGAYGAAGPLRVPVLVLSDAAIERLDRPPTVTAIDFEVRFGPEAAAWRAGNGGRSIVLARIPPHLPKEKPPVVVLSAHYDALGVPPAGSAFGDASDGAPGVACVLAAARALSPDLDAADAKAGLVICLYDGDVYGFAGSRALAPLLRERFHVIGALHVDAVGGLRDDTTRLGGTVAPPNLAERAAEASKLAGLPPGADPVAIVRLADILRDLIRPLLR